MVIQNNLMAMNANRMLGVNNSGLAKNLEKLSSGYRINRAGDDAAGLAISEKMRAQIKGLEQAATNAQDGISLIQTAEGALTEVHNMLNRMVELSMKSANGTIQDEVDREAIQAEINALNEEISRIADSTTFNGIKLLDGSLSADVGSTTAMEIANLGATYAKEFGAAGTALSGGKELNAGVVSDWTGISTDIAGDFAFEVGKYDADGKWQVAAYGASSEEDSIVRVKVTDSKTGEVTTMEANWSDIYKNTTEGAKATDVMTANGTGELDLSSFGLGKVSLIANDEVTAEGLKDALNGASMNTSDPRLGKEMAVTETTAGLAGTAQTQTVTLAGASVAGATAGDRIDLTVAGVTISAEITSDLISSAGAVTNDQIASLFDGQTITFGSGATEVNYDITVAGGQLTLTQQKNADGAYGAHTVATTGSIGLTPSDASGAVLTPGTATVAAGTTGVAPTDAAVYTVDLSSLTEEQWNNGGIVIGGTTYNAETTGVEWNTNAATTLTDWDTALGADTLKVGGRDFAVSIATPGDAKTFTLTASKVGELTANETPTVFVKDAIVEEAPAEKTGGLVLQIGDTADDFNKMAVSVDDLSAKGLGIADLDVSTEAAAADAIDIVKAAINKVSTNRANMGALQNRLEYTINNLDTTAENMQAAESRIRDTDMAAEMMEYTKNNVLVQAAQAMLAQANQQPQSVLQLLG